MLSEERIMELAEISPIWYAIPQGREKYLLTEFARRIEREAYKQGQESMRERAVSQAAEEAGEHGTDSDGWYICKSLSHQIEELEIEELK